MILQTKRVVYPEGDSREIEHELRINDMVDLNGFLLSMPLESSRMIVYRVYKMSTEVSVGEEVRNFWLERVGQRELEEYAD